MSARKQKKDPEKEKRKKKVKQPTQHTPMQRVLVIRFNRRSFEWRPW